MNCSGLSEGELHAPSLQPQPPPSTNLQSSIFNLQSQIFNLQSSFQDGNLLVNGHVYRRPCDWAADCGPVAFLGGPRAWTPAAQAALAQIPPLRTPPDPHSPLSTPHSSLSTLHSSLFTLHSSLFTPLRGLPNDFLVFAAGLEGSVPTVCGLCCAPTTLTVRFEDVWRLLPPARRALSYTCAVTRDPHAKDASSAQAEGVVRESLPGVAPDARICLDLAENGGFVLSFQPEP